MYWYMKTHNNICIKLLTFIQSIFSVVFLTQLNEQRLSHFRFMNIKKKKDNSPKSMLHAFCGVEQAMHAGSQVNKRLYAQACWAEKSAGILKYMFLFFFQKFDFHRSCKLPPRNVKAYFLINIRKCH